MRPRSGMLVFALGALVAAAVWMTAWPRHEPAPVFSPHPVPHREVRVLTPSSIELSSWLHKLETATDVLARAGAAERIGRLPVSSFPQALEGVELFRNHDISPSARALLTRWASLDGEAAVVWAWPRLRASGRWERAFAEMAAAWAWARPENLAEWARRRPKSEIRSPTLAEAEAMDVPPVGWDELDRISNALSKVDIRLAYEILQLRGGYSSRDTQLMNSLESGDQIREALAAFDCLDDMVPHRFSRNGQILAHSLLVRWKKLDPEDFARSPHARLFLEVSPKRDAPDLPPVIRNHREWWFEFQEWQKSGPYTRPDTTGWTAAKREAWEDFEALLPER